MCDVCVCLLSVGVCVYVCVRAHGCLCVACASLNNVHICVTSMATNV
jgi:hypothetical protein